MFRKFKHIIAIILVLITIFTIPVSAAISGDIDNDGKISAADARLVLRMSVGLEELDMMADVDSDGKVSAADARFILRASVGLEKLETTGEFGSSAEYNGIYTIRGYSIANAFGQTFFTLTLEGFDNNNSGNIDVTNTTINKSVGVLKNYIYLKLTFDENGVKDWSVIDKITLANWGQPDEDQLQNAVFPELEYEEVQAGKAPNIILLSNYERGKVYVFDVETEDDCFFMPEIINDTTIPVLAASIKTEKDDDFERELKVNKVIEGTGISFSIRTSYDKKLYLAIIEMPVDYLLATEDYKKLSECNIGEEIDFNFEDYLYNDTNKTITLFCNNQKYVVKPGEIIECSWMNDVMVKKIG